MKQGAQDSDCVMSGFIFLGPFFHTQTSWKIWVALRTLSLFSLLDLCWEMGSSAGEVSLPSSDMLLCTVLTVSGSAPLCNGKRRFKTKENSSCTKALQPGLVSSYLLLWAVLGWLTPSCNWELMCQISAAIPVTLPTEQLRIHWAGRISLFPLEVPNPRVNKATLWLMPRTAFFFTFNFFFI